MPCRSDYEDRLIKQDEIDLVTRLACAYCRKMEVGSGVPSWAKSWWNSHKKLDSKRMKELLKQKSEIEKETSNEW